MLFKFPRSSPSTRPSASPKLRVPGARWPQGYTYVQEIVPGFAAARQGQVQAEDIVIAVDNEPVEGWDLDAIKQLTIGDEHSFCTLLIKRGSQYLQASAFGLVPLSRRAACPPDTAR